MFMWLITTLNNSAYAAAMFTRYIFIHSKNVLLGAETCSWQLLTEI